MMYAARTVQSNDVDNWGIGDQKVLSVALQTVF
jgi:hypothetical protein